MSHGNSPFASISAARGSTRSLRAGGRRRGSSPLRRRYRGGEARWTWCAVFDAAHSRPGGSAAAATISGRHARPARGRFAAFLLAAPAVALALLGGRRSPRLSGSLSWAPSHRRTGPTTTRPNGRPGFGEPGWRVTAGPGSRSYRASPRVAAGRRVRHGERRGRDAGHHRLGDEIEPGRRRPQRRRRWAEQPEPVRPEVAELRRAGVTSRSSRAADTYQHTPSTVRINQMTTRGRSPHGVQATFGKSSIRPTLYRSGGTLAPSGALAAPAARPATFTERRYSCARFSQFPRSSS